jgi:hypothetical protein
MHAFLEALNSSVTLGVQVLQTETHVEIISLVLTKLIQNKLTHYLIYY